MPRKTKFPKGFPFLECGCKYLDVSAYVPQGPQPKGEEPYTHGSVIICNEWQRDHHCERCGWNPAVAKARLKKLYGYNEV